MHFSKKSLFFFTVAFAVLMLSSLITVHAQTITSTHSNQPTTAGLSYYENSFVNYLGENLSETGLNNLKTQWATQLAHNKDVISNTHGAVLKFSPTASRNSSSGSAGSFSSLDTLYGCYLSEICTSKDSPYEPYGHVSGTTAMEGYEDGNCAHFVTSGWNEEYNENAMGGEAFSAGWMQTTFSGDIYIRAQRTGDLTIPPWRDTVFILGGYSINQPYGYWLPIGEVTISSTSLDWVWAGNTGSYLPLNAIALACWTPAPYPNPYDPPYSYPDFFNDVQIDAVYATNSGPCVLSISNDGHGTTDQGYGGTFDYGTQVQITPEPSDNYVFDHWTLDGVDYISNPFTITMLRGQYEIEAHFRYSGPPLHWIYIGSFDTWDIPVSTAVYIDGNFVGYAAGFEGGAFQVTEGYHSIYVDDPTWDVYFNDYVPLAYFTDGYGNGDLRPIYSDWGTYVYYTAPY